MSSEFDCLGIYVILARDGSRRPGAERGARILIARSRRGRTQ